MVHDDTNSALPLLFGTLNFLQLFFLRHNAIGQLYRWTNNWKTISVVKRSAATLEQWLW